MSAQATPRPWEILVHAEDSEVLNIVGRPEQLPGGVTRAEWVAELDADGLDGDMEQNGANAELIVRAVNAHDDLLAAVRRAAQITNTFIGVLKANGYPIEETVGARDEFLALIAKAEASQ